MEQFGGSYIGSGVYGCTFRPPLLCEGETALKPSVKGMVTKLQNKDNTMREMNIFQHIRVIPLARNYFVYSSDERPCQPSELNKGHEPDLKYCDLINTYSLRGLWMYRMPYGGPITLSRLSFNPARELAEFNFWKFGKHLLEAATLLLVNGIVHFDLHAGNIVIDDDDVPRVIDWGKALEGPYATGDELMTQIQNRKFDVRYTQEPPEIPLFVAQYKGIPIDSAINALFTGQKRKAIVQMLQYLLKVNQHQLRTQLENYRERTVYFEKQTDFPKWWKSHWTTYDSWSIGVILLRNYATIMKVGDKRIYQASYSDKQTNILNALRGMCNFNCFERFNAAQALAAWDSPNNSILMRYGAKWL